MAIQGDSAGLVTQTQLSRIQLTLSAYSYRGAYVIPWQKIVPRINPMCPTDHYRAGTKNP